jgi:hypothetical protein
MKTVFDTDMCAHVWAQRTQPHGRTPSNSVHFDGAVFYSYATPIAAFAPIRNGVFEGAPVLVSAKTYSMTTASKHLPAVRRAVRGRYFTVADIGHDGGRRCTVRTGPASDPKSWAPVHVVNLQALADDYHKSVARMMRLQSWNWHDLASVRASVDGTAAPIADYAATFKVPKRVIPKLDIEADAARIWARCERLTAERAKPGAAQKAERARVARQNAAERKREETVRIARMTHAEKLEAWMNGAASQFGSFPYGAPRTDADGSAYLRVMGAVVETSLGAKAPLADVRRVLGFVDAMRKRAPDLVWTRSESEDGSEAFKLGSFTLDAVDARGVRAGCHFISWLEIDRVRPAIMAA